MSATPGTYVTIATGEVWEGAENEHQVVMEKAFLTKSGQLNGKLSWSKWLPTWDGEPPYRPYAVRVSNTARYDPETEAVANPIRAHIADLRRQMNEESNRLDALYVSQAGPQPADGRSE